MGCPHEKAQSARFEIRSSLRARNVAVQPDWHILFSRPAHTELSAARDVRRCSLGRAFYRGFIDLACDVVSFIRPA